jgi:hypothetical protein
LAPQQATPEILAALSRCLPYPKKAGTDAARVLGKIGPLSLLESIEQCAFASQSVENAERVLQSIQTLQSRWGIYRDLDSGKLESRPSR